MQRFVFGLIFLLVGVGLLVGGWFPTKSTLDLRANGDRVDATVVGTDVSSDSDGTTYAPIYEYEVDGQVRRHTRSVSSSSRPQIGEHELLLVDPADPDRVKADTFLDKWFLTTLLGGMGALFSIIGAGALLVAASGGRSAAAGDTPAAERPALGVPTDNPALPTAGPDPATAAPDPATAVPDPVTTTATSAIADGDADPADADPRGPFL